MSSANSHPGLSFGVNTLRRAFPQHPTNTPNKASPGLPQQHASPYQPPSYSPQQAPQGPYLHHPFPNQAASQVPNIGNVQNGARPPQPQVPPVVPGPRQRGAQSRQMQPNPNQPMAYLQQSMGQQPMSQQAMGQQVQQNDNPGMPQPSQHQPAAQQQTPQQTQQHQQQQVQAHAQPPRTQTPSQSQEQHEHEMEVDNQNESGDEDSLDPKMADGTPFVPREPMGQLMSAPPEGGSFPTLEAVHKAVLEYCTSVGYAIVIGRSKKTVPGLKKVLFVCDRAGKPPRRVTPEMRKRKTSSRKCDCQFGFFAIEQRTQWTVRYRPDPMHLQHNHEPSESPLLHPAARKLDSKMVAAVKSLKESGIGVSQTIEILQSEHPHVPLLPRDIYNARAAINRNPTKIASAIAEDRPAIYSKPLPTAEERIRADLRRELALVKEQLAKSKEQHDKEIEEYKEKLREKDRMIQKFEMFIDICNQRVMVQRERLADNEADGGPGGSNS